MSLDIGNDRSQLFRNEFQRLVQADPHFPWLTIIRHDAEEGYTFQDLAERVCDFCRFYRLHEIGHEDTIVIILKESLDLFAAFWAGIIHGALPAFFAYPSPKQSEETFIKSIRHLVQYNRVKMIVGFPAVVEGLKKKAIFRDPDLVGIFECSEVQKSGPCNFDEFDNPGCEAFLQFSSGTTGAKKGVKITTAALFHQLQAYRVFLKLNPSSKIVSWLPHYHDMGLIACMLLPFLMKVPLCMMSPFEWVANPRMLWEVITRHQATHLWLPNFALSHLTRSVAEEELAQYDLSSIEQLVCCSETVLFDTVSKFLGKFEQAGLRKESLHNCYAMAENTFAMTSTEKGGIEFLSIDPIVFMKEHRIEPQIRGRSIACAGIPLENLRMKIVDDRGAEVGTDRVGEIIIQSNCMLEDYHNNPEATAAAFLDDWFKTGDLGFFHAGRLYVTGRKKELIVVGGENIYPQDIETILNEVDYLIPGRNVVFGLLDERLGTERVIILAECKIGFENQDTTPIRQKIAETLSLSVSDMILLPHMTLLKGTAGKISRHLNKSEYIQGAFDKYVRDQTGGGEEGKLMQLVLDIFPGSNKPSIDSTTPLFSSGLIDSFGLLDLINAIETEYRFRIPQSFCRADYFDSLARIKQTIDAIAEKAGSLSLDSSPPPPKARKSWMEFIKRFFADE